MISLRTKGMKKTRYTRLMLSGVRRSLIYRPLAILMSILLLPAIPWVERAGVGVPFEVQAQIGSCASITRSIIRNYCGADGTIYFTDLTQLESAAVQAYLTEHNIPDTDAHVINDYGRADLRSKILAHISSTLLGIVKKEAPRTPHEQQLFNWLQGLVHRKEITLYEKPSTIFEPGDVTPAISPSTPPSPPRLDSPTTGCPSAEIR
jgi:hypothetical protein